MKYERFEDLPVWQAAADLAAKMILWTAHPWFRGQGDLKSQLQRASLSVSNNIAEGFERGSTSELLHFLYIARGSAGEVRSSLAVMERMDALSKSTWGRGLSNPEVQDSPQPEHFKSQISDFKAQCENISRQLYGWANSLQNSDIDGQRHLNDKTRQTYDQRQRREAFQKKLDATNEELRRKREAEQQQRTQQQKQSPQQEGEPKPEI
ncbi:MAG: four helix bundle protein [Planctomycetaceae bacterium]|nr:four helix bundle protein [Planctomycetaceae bacterium]